MPSPEQHYYPHKNAYKGQCNNAVAYKFEDKEPTKVIMAGYITGKEVESLPIAEKGQYKFSQLASCYYCRLEDLHRANEFITILQNIKKEFVD